MSNTQLLLSLTDLNFDIDLVRVDQGYLNGSEENELLLASNNINYEGFGTHNRIEGRGGDDILIGSNGNDVLNPGSGSGYVVAGNGYDTVYIDHTGYDPLTNTVDQVYIDFTDTDNREDKLVFGNDTRQFGTTLGTTFVEVQGWGEEDTLIMRDFGLDVNDYWYTVPAGSDLLVYAAHDTNLSVIRFNDVLSNATPVNIQETNTL